MDLSDFNIDSPDIRVKAEDRLATDTAFFNEIMTNSSFTGQNISGYEIYENEVLKLKCIHELELDVPDELQNDFVLIKLQDTPIICLVYIGNKDLDPYFKPKSIQTNTFSYDNIAGLFHESRFSDFENRLIFINAYNHKTLIGTIDIESTINHEKSHYLVSFFEEEYEPLAWYLTRLVDEIIAYHLADNVFPDLDGFLYPKDSNKFSKIAYWPKLTERELLILTNLYVSLSQIHLEHINGNYVFPIQILRDFIVTKDIHALTESISRLKIDNVYTDIDSMCSLIADAFEFISLQKHFPIESMDIKFDIIFNIYKLSIEHAITDMDQYNLVMILASAVRKAFNNLSKVYKISDVDNKSEYNHLYHLYNVIAVRLAALPKFQEILAANYHTIDSIIPNLRDYNSSEENHNSRNEFELWVMKLYKKSIETNDSVLEEKLRTLVEQREDSYNSNYYEILAELKQVEL